MRPALISLSILCAGLWINTRPLRAIPEYTDKEKKECAFCHPNGDLFALNDAGMYYAQHKTLEGYESGEPEPPKTPKPETPKPAKPEVPKPEAPKPDPEKKP